MRRRKEQAEETKHMEKEMEEALQSMRQREEHEEAARRSAVRSTRIATPGTRRDPGTPRVTPRRFGI